MEAHICAHILVLEDIYVCAYKRTYEFGSTYKQTYNRSYKFWSTNKHLYVRFFAPGSYPKHVHACESQLYVLGLFIYALVPWRVGIKW